MAKLIQLSDTSWKQPFKDRKKEMHLWVSHTKVASFCGLKNQTKRLLNIKFEKKFNIDETRYFQITSGKEIYFPKDFQDKIGNVIFQNPESYFIVKVLDSDENLSLTDDEIEQEELIKYYKKNKSKEEIIKELLNLKDSDTIQITVNHKSYKRDNKTTAQIKIIRDFKCQICGYFILKKDGNRYIEAAHIIPKNLKGKETPENIILLCPNHHKEFDLGEKEIITQDTDKIEFNLNGKLIKLNLALK